MLCTKGNHTSEVCRTCKSGFAMIAAAVDQKTSGRPSQTNVRPRPVAFPTKQTRHHRHSAPAVHASTFFEPATVHTDVSASATVPTTVPAGTSTVPAAITADDPATVPSAASGDATTADVPGADSGATADVPGTDPGATNFDVSGSGTDLVLPLLMFLVLLSHTKAHHTAIMAVGISVAMF